MKRLLIAATAALLAVASLSTVALADRAYHSSHIPLEPVGGAPLRSGFVENIHPNGPNVYAVEVYVLNGAEAGTEYQVFLNVFPFDPSCSGAPAASINTATIVTNPAGNGRGTIHLIPADAAGLRGATHGAMWTVETGGAVAYATACEVVVLD